MVAKNNNFDFGFDSQTLPKNKSIVYYIPKIKHIDPTNLVLENKEFSEQIHKGLFDEASNSF